MDHIRPWATGPARADEHSPRPEDLLITGGLPATRNGASECISHPSGATPPDIPATEKGKSKKEPVLKRFLHALKKILLSSWMNILLVFVPVGIACHFANVDPTIVFVMNALAIVPLAGLLGYATESVAYRLGDTLGALLNVSFGNAVELIIFIVALVKDKIRIVQASLIGSILANLLLILGMCFLIGGLQYREQIYNNTVTQMSSCLLSLSVLSLLLPTAFHASFRNEGRADSAVIKVSRGTSVVLLLVYVLYLLFQLKSHAYMYLSTPQHVIDEESHPGILQRMNSKNSSVSSKSSPSSIRSSKSTNKVARKAMAKFGRRHVKLDQTSGGGPSGGGSEEGGRMESKGKGKAVVPPMSRQGTVCATMGPSPAAVAATTRAQISRSISLRPPPIFRASTLFERSGLHHTESTRPALYRLRHHRSLPSNFSAELYSRQPRYPSTPGTPETVIEPPLPKPEISRTASLLLLLGSTALVAVCVELLIGSIDHLVKNTPLSEAFVGLIVLPVVGNAAEHVTAVTVAARNKMDLAIGVAVGSSIQIALFVTPLVVIVGWILGKQMSLYFNLFETVTLFASAFIVNFLVLDGRSNYLEGALLCAAYIIIGVGAFFFPNGNDQNSFTSGPGTLEREPAMALVGSIGMI